MVKYSKSWFMKVFDHMTTVKYTEVKYEKSFLGDLIKMFCFEYNPSM